MNEHVIRRRMRADGYSDDHIERVTDELADYQLQDDRDRESAEALAARRLTKAAPNMLHALRISRLCLKYYVNVNGSPVDVKALALVENAIEDATGEKP